MARDITIVTHLPDPPEVVWQALTDPAALSEWLMPVQDFSAVVGCRFRLTAKPMPGWDGIVDCEVLEVDEGRLLSYSWRGTRMTKSTTVTWTLTAADDGGTELRLDHRGFTGVGGSILRVMHRGGWRKFVARGLADHLARQRGGDQSVTPE
jgi:uncharacterized protein YndB with AHSA1/START domain